MARPRERERNGFEEKLFRLLGMALFAFLLYFTFLLFLVLAALQWIFAAIEDKPNPELKAFMDRLRAYAGEIFAYLGFATEKHPFPFSPFPKK